MGISFAAPLQHHRHHHLHLLFATTGLTTNTAATTHRHSQHLTEMKEEAEADGETEVADALTRDIKELEEQENNDYLEL